jgi:hypothetical protein
VASRRAIATGTSAIYRRPSTVLLVLPIALAGLLLAHEPRGRGFAHINEVEYP